MGNVSLSFKLSKPEREASPGQNQHEPETASAPPCGGGYNNQRRIKVSLASPCRLVLDQKRFEATFN